MKPRITFRGSSLLSAKNCESLYPTKVHSVSKVSEDKVCEVVVPVAATRNGARDLKYSQ
jgi:hypothetical protein